MLLLCRFVPGGRMAAGYHAGRSGYPIRLFVAYDGAAALAWATYGGLVGHIGGTALTQSAWRLFAIAAAAAVIFGTAGWVLALFGGRKQATQELAAEAGEVIDAAEAGGGSGASEAGSSTDRPARAHHCSSCCISWRAASAIEPDSDG